MDNAIYVTGHKNPDTDSICAAIAVADMKRRCGINAVACRLGPLNDETKFVLKRFAVENPLLLSDARSTLADIEMDEATLISKDATAHYAWKEMFLARNKSLFATDEQGNLCGLVTTSNLSQVRLMDDKETDQLMSTVSLQNFADTLKGRILCQPEHFSTDGNINIITLENEEVLAQKKCSNIAILSSSAMKHQFLINHGTKLLIITCGIQVEQAVIDNAKAHDVAIIATDRDTMHVARIIMESYTIEHIMTRSIISFSADEFVDDVASKMANSRVCSYPVLNAEGHIVGAISRYHTQNYRRKQFILVDHSAKNQSINHIEDAEIQEIIDHHHIGNIETDYPINYRNQKVGCTCTIVANLYQENGLLPDATMSGLMLSAILSDTLNFKSATATSQDRETAIWLAERAGIKDLNAYALEMLSASVALKDSTPHEILNRDLKTYSISHFKMAIGQTNYSHIEEIQALLPKFRGVIEEEMQEKGLDLMVMMFTNVMAEGTMFVYYGSLSYLVTGILKTKFDDHFGFDPDIISRKQQLMPKLSSLLKSMS